MRSSYHIFWLSWFLDGAQASSGLENDASPLQRAKSFSAPLAPRSGGPYAYPDHIYNANASDDQSISDYVPFPGGCTNYTSNGSIADAITQCTSSQCDNHFGAICTGHANLVDKSCFCNSFNIEPYFAQCSKTVIGAAQLYRWFETLCSDPGVQWSNVPANLTSISNPNPTDLKAGYKDADIQEYAPSCLQNEGGFNGKQTFNSTWATCQFNNTGWNDIFGNAPLIQSQSGNYLDIQCFCSQVGSAPLKCTSGLDPTQELLWWNATCGPSFEILSSNWSAQVVIQDSSHIKAPAIWPDCMQSDATCNGTLFNVTAENLSQRCIVDANGYCSTIAESFEMGDFCNKVNFKDTCVGTCQKGLDHTRALLWWDYICGNQDLPTSWRDSLYIANSSYLSNATSNVTWPRCLHNSTAANDSISASTIQCSSDRCILDENGLCTNNANFTNQKCFCGPLRYQAVCPDFDTAACTSISERQDYLLWLNSTCSSDTEWYGLPNRWSDGLEPLVDDMIPWHWRLEPDKCLPNVNYTEHCPSNAAKLGIFAAVNAAMLIATLVLGRRTIVSWLTCGYLGGAHSKWWFVSASIVVALQLVSNLLIALLIRRVPGYSHISIGGLTLLWCTRPRVSWLAILLISISAEEAMYFSTAASSLLAELVLQILGSYCMGVVANYGTKNNFYHGSLHKAQRMKYAQMMYAGSLLWLLVVIIAIWAVAWSALHVNKVIAEVGSEVVRVKRRNITKQRTADQFAKEARNCKRNAHVREHNINERVKAMETSDMSSRSINSQSGAGDNHSNAVERAEYNSWSRLSRSCGILASSWARVEQEILQVLEEEKRQVGVRQGKLGVKDVFRIQKKIIALDQKIVGLDSNDTNAAKIQIYRNERRVLHQKLSSYAEMRERELHACLQTAQGQQISCQRNCEDARPDFTTVNADLSPEFDKTWAAIQEDWSKIGEAWRRIANSWHDELDILDRVKKTSSGREESRYILKTLNEGKTRKKMRTIPIVVCMGMLLCWIAQWLFWAGFVNVISDGYCPPSLGNMVGIWIGFSVTGAGVGASL